MSVEADLVAALSGQTAAGTRIYPDTMPESVTLPAIVYQRVGTEHVYASGSVPLRRVRMQIDVWSDRRQTTIDVAGQIHSVLDMTVAAGGPSLPVLDMADYDAEAGLYRWSADYHIWEA